jgi:hypothetical protein
VNPGSIESDGTMSPPKPVLREAAVAVPIGTSAAIASQRVAFRLRTWILGSLLFLVPLLAYWPATFHAYGLRDDYSNLREAHEELDKVVRFCASHARPIYGWLLQASYGQTTSVQNLQWMRFMSALLLGAISLACYRGLRTLGWSFTASLCFALLLALVPASQVIASWAVGWPYALTALIAIAAFFTAEGALASGAGVTRVRSMGQLAAAVGLMIACALIYQPSAMFYAVPLAAALIARRHRSIAQTARWMALHVGLVTASFGLAYCIMSVLYASGIFVKSNRIAFEHHWGDKIAWFLQETLPNALSLFVLNDNNHRDWFLYLGCAGLIGMLLITGAYLEWRRFGRERGIIYTAALIALPVFACSISLVASEHYATYRTIFAMTAVLLCFLVASIGSITAVWKPASRRVLAALAVAVAFMTAQHHAYALIAVPQGNEWNLILSGAKRVNVNLDGQAPSVFAIASTPADISTATIYHDEFGSLSSNSEWVPREMFKQAMHDLHPEIDDLDSRYTFASGPRLPNTGHYDVIIDLHNLRKYYTNN